jgi:hypothetical protein
MKSYRRLVPWLAVLLVVCLVWVLRSEVGKRRTDEKHGQISKHGFPSGASKVGKSDDSSSIVSPSTAADVARLIEQILARFLASPGPEESTAILQELRERIRAADNQAATEAIVDFLKSGKDAPTRLPFVVGPEGGMETTPTLRTALLDLLPSLDPTVALETARGVMDGKNSPDEYALALRNLAWNDAEGDLKKELSDRLEQMIDVKDWVINPSSGFLEALDAGVEISTKQSFDSIVRLDSESLAASNEALVRASFIALDRMVLRNPSLLVDTYSQDPEMSGLSPDQRASLLSRLDIADPAQRNVFVNYLSASNHGVGELDYFTSLFPNGNYVHGNWLITSGESTHSINSRLQADRGVLVEIDRLISNSSNERMNQALVQIREHLQKVTQK